MFFLLYQGAQRPPKQYDDPFSFAQMSEDIATRREMGLNSELSTIQLFQV